jgi:predicted PurR-regulated permease PerM
MDVTPSSSVARSLGWLSKLSAVFLVIAGMSLARSVLVPIAVALLLSFILTAPVKWLQRLGLPRRICLAVVMVLALSCLAGTGYFLARQLGDLADQVSHYTESMRRRVAALPFLEGGPWASLEHSFDRVTAGLERRTEALETVRTVTGPRSAAERLRAGLEPLFAPLTNALIVFVLCLFMLGHREDLRNRLLRLAGTQNLMLTTRALDDGAHRISRYLSAQLGINAAFGAVLACGLYAIGIPYAALWGATAGLLRFVPYVGAAIGALLPATLAFALFPGWEHTVLTVAVYAVLALLTAGVVEPLLIGKRTGVSSVALLVSILFWTWLWGPIGLVLSAPLTVSLAVLGRHLPPLHFLAVMLGDEQPLGPAVSFYQRLLARDEDEAGEIVTSLRPSLEPLGVLERVILPALTLASRDRERHEISEADVAFVTAVSGELIAQVSPKPPRCAAPGGVIGIAANGVFDERVLDMLASAMSELEIVPADADLAEIASRIQSHAPQWVCIAALPPAGGPRARQCCQWLKERFPNLRVMVLRPGDGRAESNPATARFVWAGADTVVTNLTEAVLCSRAPRLKRAA